MRSAQTKLKNLSKFIKQAVENLVLIRGSQRLPLVKNNMRAWVEKRQCMFFLKELKVVYADGIADKNEVIMNTSDLPEETPFKK